MSDPKINIGKVLTATRQTYNVDIKGQVIQCTIRGKLAADNSGGGDRQAIKVGDDVKVSFISEREGIIEAILPRKSQLTRSIANRAYQEHIIAVNINQMLIILSSKKPKFKSGLLDRFLVIAEKNRLRALICINKMDLSDPETFEKYRQYYSRLDYPLFFTSALTGDGIGKLETALANTVTAVVGQSGVGKSSIIMAIDGKLNIKIGEVSKRTRKGQHTTASVQLFPLSNNGFVIDTPGIRELGFWEIYKKDLANYFKEIKKSAPDCQFGDCQHINEPGCAIKNAVETGEILKERYENYLNIHDSLTSAPHEYRSSR